MALVLTGTSLTSCTSSGPGSDTTVGPRGFSVSIDGASAGATKSVAKQGTPVHLRAVKAAPPAAARHTAVCMLGMTYPCDHGGTAEKVAQEEWLN